MAEHEMWVWIVIYGLACVSSVWLGWLAWRTVAPFALAVAVLGLELPLAVVGAGLDGARGAATGVVVGLMLASVPIMVAVMWLVVAGPGAIARLPQIREGVLPYACVVWTAQAAAICVWQDASVLLAAAALLVGVWALDRFVREQSWFRTWVNARASRGALILAAGIMVMPIMVAYGLRTGNPKSEAAARYVTDQLALSSLNFVVVLALISAFVALLGVVGDATRDQGYLVAIGLLALYVWLLVAVLLPASFANYAVWGVLYSASCYVVVLVVLWFHGRPKAFRTDTSSDGVGSSG